jgi:hypothetical protein
LESVSLIPFGAKVIMAITLGEPMPNELQAKITKRLEEITGQRFCTSCQLRQAVERGTWINSANGLRRRWKCAGCIQRQKERLQTIS